MSWDFGPLRAILASPRFHRWHHTSAEEGRDKNFAGLLPLWDILFGTYYIPDSQPTGFGVSDLVPAISLDSSYGRLKIAGLPVCS